MLVCACLAICYDCCWVWCNDWFFVCGACPCTVSGVSCIGAVSNVFHLSNFFFNLYYCLMAFSVTVNDLETFKVCRVVLLLWWILKDLFHNVFHILINGYKKFLLIICYCLMFGSLTHILVIFSNCSTKRIVMMLVSQDSSHCLQCRYVGFMACAPRSTPH